MELCGPETDHICRWEEAMSESLEEEKLNGKLWP
jgi:hypothetical protein